MTERLLALFSLSAMLAVTTPVAGGETDQLLQEAGVRGGLIVQVGCDDVAAIVGLRANEGCLVHSLDTSAEKVAAARQSLQSLNLYGPASVAQLEAARLPLVSGSVNLLVVFKRFGLSAAELARVVAPRGVVLVQQPLAAVPSLDERSTALSGWHCYVRRVPASIDQWGHYLHGADNNALSADTVAGPPRHMQWLSGPTWTRHHHADKGTYPTIRALVSADGRLFYLLDETPSSNVQVPSRWVLVARDGFSGVQLWKRPVEALDYPRQLEQVWRQLVADDTKVYAQLTSGGPLSQLDAASGEVLQTYRDTKGFAEVIKDGNTLLLVDWQHQLLALDAVSGETRWRWRPGQRGEIVPLTLAGSQGRVFVKTAEAACCLSAADGSELWAHQLNKAKRDVRLKWPRERLIVADGVVLVSFGGNDPQSLNRDKDEFLGSHPRVREYDGRLAALSALDGHQLWETDYRPNLESAPGEIYVHEGLVWLGPDFAEARDLQTGEIQGGLPGVLEQLWTDGHHHRCYPGKATSRYIFTGKRGIELFDLQGDHHSRNNWIRATCRVGFTPCNGLVYAPPHSCGCYMEALLKGFWALAAEGTRTVELVDTGARLQRGEAYGSDMKDVDDTSQQWPTYRGNNERGGSLKVNIGTQLNEVWRAQLGGRLSSLTVADGKLFVAQVDQHTLHALDINGGRELWQFTTGGRVDSPPTFYRGLLLLGSRDGHVYCLRADDGKLVWRFRAAPGSTKAVAYEQLESLWPVCGSVLVEQQVAYVAAGRSSYLDGGIRLVALDPLSGSLLHEKTLKSEHPGASSPPEDAELLKSRNRQNWSDYKTQRAPDRSDSFSMQGALTDVMSADKGTIFMRQLRFDRALSPITTRRQHLFSTSSLLDGSEHHRTYWILGSGDFSNLPVAFPWIVGQQLQVPFGMMLAFDESTVWSVRGGAGRQRQDPAYRVICSHRPDGSSEASGLGDFERRRMAREDDEEPNIALWETPLNSRPRALIRVGQQLCVGGMKDTDYTHALDDWRAGSLTILSSVAGTVQNTLELSAPPVWDGMAAAQGRLFVAQEDGVVVCLGD